MRTLIQRVTNAKVVVGGETISQIQNGILALVGCGKNDTLDDVLWTSKKLLSLRIFDENGKPWTGSITSLGYSLLLVSQFTLHASCKKTKPSFQRAMGGDEAKVLFDALVAQCREGGVVCETGQFGEMMEVSLTNDGPVTFFLDSKNQQDLPFDATSDEVVDGEKN